MRAGNRFNSLGHCLKARGFYYEVVAAWGDVYGPLAVVCCQSLSNIIIRRGGNSDARTSDTCSSLICDRELNGRSLFRFLGQKRGTERQEHPKAQEHAHSVQRHSEKLA